MTVLTRSFVVIFLATASFLQAKETIEFNPRMKVGPESAEQQLECFITKSESQSSGYVFQMKWPAQRAAFVGGHLIAPPAFPVLFDKPGRYKITATVNLEQVGKEIQKLALRVLDGSGAEVFQIGAPLKGQGDPGWEDVTWEINTRTFKPEGVTWGSKVDGELDLPVHFLGFAFNFKNMQTDGGVLEVSKVVCEKVGGSP